MILNLLLFVEVQNKENKGKKKKWTSQNWPIFQPLVWSLLKERRVWDFFFFSLLFPFPAPELSPALWIKKEDTKDVPRGRQTNVEVSHSFTERKKCEEYQWKKSEICKKRTRERGTVKKQTEEERKDVLIHSRREGQ